MRHADFAAAQESSRAATLRAVADWHALLDEDAGRLELESARLMKAVAEVESGLGTRLDLSTWRLAATEDLAYLPGGPLHEPARWAKHGTMAASAWGPWQVMYPVAVRLGYPATTRPTDDKDGLWRADVGAQIAVKLLAAVCRDVASFRATAEGRLDRRDALALVGDVLNAPAHNERAGAPKGYSAALRDAYALHGHRQRAAARALPVGGTL